MTHRILAKNWHSNLTNALEQSQEGDRILVVNTLQKALAKKAKQRICPKKQIYIETIEDIGWHRQCP